MRVQGRVVLSCFILIGILISILLISVSCWGTPSMEIIVENQTEYDLTILIKDWEIGSVSPGAQITATTVLTGAKYHIIARNPQGEIVFYEILTLKEMQMIESRVYKVIIK